jgi:hypothetical protein
MRRLRVDFTLIDWGKAFAPFKKKESPPHPPVRNIVARLFSR